jgi:hypothetical protein
MEQISITIAVLTLAVVLLLWPVLIVGGAESAAPGSDSCPSGQAPVLNETGKPIINKQTHSITCLPIDAYGNLLGQ